MKKLLILFSFIIISCYLALATAPSMTNVSATLTDSSTQIWTNGSWQATFQTPFGNPNIPSNNGNPVIQQYSGFMDGSGHFTVSLDDNNVVTPTGSHWVFTLCPNATAPVCSNATVLVTGVSQDLSSTLSAALNVPIVQTKPTIFRAYNDTEAFGGLGALYVRTNDNTLRLCNTPAGCPGSGWTAASVSSANPVFTGTVQINGDLNVTGTTNLNILNVTGLATFSDCINYSVSTLDFTRVCPQAGGPFNINLPTSSGTFAVSATSPIVLNATTGNISCPTCSTGGVTFPLLAPDGLSTAPSYSFSGGTDTGMYRDTNGDLDLVAHGNLANPQLNIRQSSVRIPSNSTWCFTMTGDPTAGACDVSFTHSTGVFRLLSTGSLSFVLNGTLDQAAGVNEPYVFSGGEVSTPSNPGATFEDAYFKAGKGLCSLDSAGIEYCGTPAGSQVITTFHFNTCSNSGATTDTCAVGAQALPATQPDTNYELVCNFDSGPNTGGFCTNSNGGNPCPGSISIYNKTTTTFGYALTTTRGVTGSEFGVAMCHVGHS